MKTNQRAMRSVWHSLLWKEWHEHKWKLAALTVMLVAAFGLFRFGLDDFSSMRTMMFAILVPYCVLAGAFLGMSTAGRESGRGTLPFLQSLPAPMWQPGITKLSMAILTAILPVLALAGMFTIWWFSGEESSRFIVVQGQVWHVRDWVATTTLIGALGVISLLLWMATTGANQSDEIRAGAIGFLVISFVWLVLAYCAYQAETRKLPNVSHGIQLLQVAAPGGVGSTATIWKIRSGNYLLLLVIGLIGHGCVLAWYLRHFGKVVAKPGRISGGAYSLALGKNLQLGPPRRNQFSAIAWKQVRETGPLSLLALGGILVLTTAAWLYDDRGMDARDFGEVLAGISLSVCFLVTLVTGMGVFFEDLKPGVDDFWRSRPVNRSLWFGVKFVVGLAVLIAAFGTLFLFAHWLTDASLLRRERQPLVTAVFFGAVFLLIYTLSMATYCLLRQPIYAAVLTFSLLYGGMFAVSWITHFFLRGLDVHWSIGLATMLFCQACATAVAWRAVRNDWGWKG